ACQPAHHDEPASVAPAASTPSSTPALATTPVNFQFHPDAPFATVASQSGDTAVTFTQHAGRLMFAVTLKKAPAIESSPMVFTVDDVDLTADAEPTRIDSYQIHETYPWVGIHSLAINNCRGQRITLRHKSGARYTLDVRAFDDAIAFRFIVPDAGHPRVPDEATTFTLPAGSIGWFHGLSGHYEGEYARHEIEQVSAGEWAAPPVTFRLPSKHGYVAITEADLKNYAGMALQADGQRGFTIALGHRQPVSGPFRLRYRASEARRLSVAASVDGEIVTPWRVMVLGSDLDTLVNSDAITSLCPPPDKAIFPQGPATDWVKSGRAVWRYLDGGDQSAQGIRHFFDGAHQLGFEYQIVEGMWRRWSPAELKGIIDYGKQRNVGMFAWVYSKDLHDPAARAALFARCESAGIAGLKIDFFDSEAKELVDLYQAILREGAQHHLLIDFHGANKPTGQRRTWPNELSREAVRGMESSRMTARAFHDTTLPFTRWLAGPADYTPVLFTARRADTTWAHQVATAMTLTSPLLTYGANPDAILQNPAVEMIKSIPCTWDETIVLPASEIGECAAIARRHGDMWFLAITNGPAARSMKISLSFLDEADCHALIVSDPPNGNGGQVDVKQVDMHSRQPLALDLRPGGGYLARYAKFAPGEKFATTAPIAE
ncbi:MAG TPA: glycoside hydrolase family 97 catalytic domain-containing protein, partial [Tepidisphaeraceae bacterium]|nr:glycoside hydrolase family 97 catalytic domain-containing protein [Tepidisphaeraceae bacterium]